MDRKFSRLAMGLFALPLIPLAIGLILITGGGTADSAANGIGTVHYKPVAGTSVTNSKTLSTKPEFAKNSLVLPAGSGALVARIEHPTAMLASPHGRRIGTLGLRSQFGSPVVVWVKRVSGKWLGVISPTAGDNRLGWIRASATSLSRVNYEIKVSLSKRHVYVLYRGHQIESYLIAIGMPSAPTPTGDYAVTDRLNTGDPTGPYGCCILATSALAPHAIQDWSGGNRIAIHSTPETWSIGHNVSHGCMRLTLPEGRWLITHVPLGTPIIIRE